MYGIKNTDERPKTQSLRTNLPIKKVSIGDRHMVHLNQGYFLTACLYYCISLRGFSSSWQKLDWALTVARTSVDLANQVRQSN
jgi:hypothetical protein